MDLLLALCILLLILFFLGGFALNSLLWILCVIAGVVIIWRLLQGKGV